MLTATHPSPSILLSFRTRIHPSPRFPPFPLFPPPPRSHSLPYKEVLGKIRDGERPITVCFQKHAVSFGRRKKASSRGVAGKGAGVAAAAAVGASKGRAASASGADDDGSVVAAAPRMTYKDRVMLFQNTLKTPSLNMNVVQSLAFEGIPDYGEGTPGLRSIYWMILLGYLPLERDQWGETLKTKHQLYAEFKADLIAKPSHGDGESKEGGGGGGARRGIADDGGAAGGGGGRPGAGRGAGGKGGKGCRRCGGGTGGGDTGGGRGGGGGGGGGGRGGERQKGERGLMSVHSCGFHVPQRI